MSISFQCYSCQKVLRVGDDKAGKKAKCAQCGTILTIPMAAEEEEVVVAEVEAEPEPRPKPRPSRDDDDLDDDVRPRPRKRRDDDDDDRPRKKRYEDDDDDRPRKRRDDDYDDDDDRPRRRARGRDDDDYDDDDRPRKRRRDDDDDWDRKKSGKSAWPKVRVGLLLAFIGMCVMAGGYGVQGVGMLLLHTNSFRASQIVSAIGTIIEVGGLITAVVGYVFWVFVNNKFGLLAFGISTLAINGVYLIFQIVNRLVPAFDAFGRTGFGLEGLVVAVTGNQLFMFVGSRGAFIVGIILSQALIAACFIMPAFYLLALGKNFRDRGLSGKGSLLIILSGVSAGVAALAGIILVSMSGGSGSRAVLIILQILTFGAQTFLYIMFIVALHHARGTVD